MQTRAMSSEIRMDGCQLHSGETICIFELELEMVMITS